MRPSKFTRLSEIVIFSYLVLASIFILFFRGCLVDWRTILFWHILAIGTVILIARLQKAFPRNFLLALIRNWLPLPCIFFGYRMVHFLVNCERNHGFLPDRDQLLIAADRFLFGGDPTVWLQRISAPWLTELMQLGYATNYFLPLLLVLILCLRRERIPFQKSVYVITLGYFLSFVGYFLVPAVGPRFTISHSCELHGLFLYHQLGRLIYFMEACPRDCFPSGHTEIPLITLWLAFRFRRPLFWIYLPVASLLIFSTIYLRFHYVIDVIAGIVLAGIVILVGKYGGPEEQVSASR